MTKQELQWITRLDAFDKSVVAEIFWHYQPKLYASLRKVYDKEVIKDGIQEALTRLLQKLDRCEKINIYSDLGGYLYYQVKDMCSREMRKKYRNTALLASPESDATLYLRILDIAEKEMLTHPAFSERCHNIFREMALHLDKTMSENAFIAQQLGFTVTQIANYKTKCRQELTAYLAQYLD